MATKVALELGKSSIAVEKDDKKFKKIKETLSTLAESSLCDKEQEVQQE